MLVIPAIDIRNGRCVRLFQGDYDLETVYAEDPVAVAQRWEREGAPLLHLVDLDGAADGQHRNLPAIAGVVAGIGIPVELGGGLRTWADIEAALAAGVSRVILGTAALEDEGLLRKAIAELGDRLVIGIDARRGLVATRGWRHLSTVQAVDMARAVEEHGARRIIYTDIFRDGTLTEPNYEALSELVAAVGIPVIASGGVSHTDHIKELARLGVEGAIVGRALYTGHLDLGKALQAARREGQ